MPLTQQSARHGHAKGSLLVVACIAGLVAAVASASPARSDPASVVKEAASTTYPKAGVILQTKLPAHASPSSSSAVVTVFPQFRRDFRPTTLLALGERKDAKGVRWLKLSLPMRPNGRTGWVKAGAVQMRPVRRSIVIDLSSRKLRVLEDGKTRFATRVAVGRRGMETPTGRNFYLTATFKPTERFLGSFAFETSAYSKLSDWPGGGIVGIHGTNTPSLLGQAVSHGCVRVANEAIVRLGKLVPVGTPIRIVA
jgi:hypothetical protein